MHGDPVGTGGEERAVPTPVVLAFPFRGRWLARNSPARRVPSHGSDLFGTRFAIDFIAVDELGSMRRIEGFGHLRDEPDRPLRLEGGLAAK